MPSFHPCPSPLTLPAGMRATRAVQALLSVLPQQQPALGWSEALVEAALQLQGVQINRVSVYRALDRLVQACVLLRTVDAQRVGRYWVTETTPSTAMAHMECKACHQPIALDAGAQAVQAALLALRQAIAQTTGVTHSSLDVTLQSECADCAHGVTPSSPTYNHSE